MVVKPGCFLQGIMSKEVQVLFPGPLLNLGFMLAKFIFERDSSGRITRVPKSFCAGHETNVAVRLKTAVLRTDDSNWTPAYGGVVSRSSGGTG